MEQFLAAIFTVLLAQLFVIGMLGVKLGGLLFDLVLMMRQVRAMLYVHVEHHAPTDCTCQVCLSNGDAEDDE